MFIVQYIEGLAMGGGQQHSSSDPLLKPCQRGGVIICMRCQEGACRHTHQRHVSMWLQGPITSHSNIPAIPDDVLTCCDASIFSPGRNAKLDFHIVLVYQCADVKQR